MLRFFRDLIERRELLLILTGRNIKIRYKNSVLGFFWTLLAPLFMIVIYSAFARIMRWSLGRADFLEFLVVGIVMWQFLMMCLNDSLNAISGSANLVKKTAFPRHVLPVSTVLANGINFLLTFAVLFVFLILRRSGFQHLWLLPLVIVSQTALCMGLALAISASHVFFKDTEHALGVGTLAWFFLSPVFYNIEMQMDFLPAVLQPAVFLNPMSGLLCSYRFALMAEPFAGARHVWISFAMAWAVLLAGVAIFQAAQKRFADEL